MQQRKGPRRSWTDGHWTLDLVPEVPNKGDQSKGWEGQGQERIRGRKREPERCRGFCRTGLIEERRDNTLTLALTLGK